MKHKLITILLVFTLIVGIATLPCTVLAAEENSGDIAASAGAVTLQGKKIYNLDYNDYTCSDDPVTSYLSESSDGLLERVQYDTSGSVLAEQYSSNGNILKKTITLNKELGIFGGYYCGENFNFLVFGSANPSERNTVEILRIVKYSKEWARVSSVSIYGENTKEPIAAGSLRMAEANGTLYIHTCHRMYKSSDGYNHQANMTFAINESDMSVKDKYTGIMNIAQAGYVSHSFNQFAQTDENYLFRVDHGDAYPRGISITKALLNGKITNVSYTIPVSLSNTGSIGENYTGASVGGFELSDNNCLIAFNAVDFTKQNVGYEGVRNIYVSVTDKSFTKSSNIKITNYSANGNLNAKTPQLVKLKNNRFLLMWREENRTTLDCVTKLAVINENGQIAGSVITSNMPLSDCQPILCSDGLVKWYVGDRNFTILYSVDPENLKSTPSVAAPAKAGVPAILKLENTRQGLTVTVNKATSSAYNLIYYKTAAQKSWSQVKINKTLYTISGVKSGTLYYVQTQSFDAYGPSGQYSSVKSMTYLDPVSITGLSYNGGNSLAWNKVNGANKYQIAALKSGDSDFTYYTTNQNSFTDKNVKADTKYSYQVRAMYQTNGGGTAYGAWSPAKTISTPSGNIKPAISVANYRNGLGVVWSSVPDASNYIVYYKTKADAAWSRVTAFGTSCVISGLDSGKLYYIQVQPVLKSGTGGNYSSVKSMTYLASTNITGLSYNGNCTLNWNQVTGANKFQIARLKKGDKTFSYFYSDTASFVEKNAVGGTVYTYQVRPMYQTANNGTAYGAWSQGKSVTTLVAPTAKLSKSSSGLTLSWNSIRGAKKFEITLLKGAASNATTYETANLSYTFNNLEKGKIYVAYVQAVSDNVKGPISAIQSIDYK